MMKHKLQAVLFRSFFAKFFLISTACAAPSLPNELLQDSLVYCTNATGFSFNSRKSGVGTNMNVVMEQIYDKLIEFDPQTNSLKPALAERYEISDDGLLISLDLRKNVAFHQTEWFTPTRKLNAEDVVFSLQRFLEGHSNVAEVSALTDGRVQIRLVRPDSAFLSHLTSRFAVILSKEYASLLMEKREIAQLDILPVGTGVYQLSSYVPNDYVRLRPNPYYWGKTATIRNMIVDFSATATGRMAKFLNGDCDVSAFPEPSQIQVLSPEQGYSVETRGANLLFVAFNFKRPIGNNPALRQKITQAINRKRLAELFFYGQAEVAENVLPKALFNIENIGSYDYSDRVQAEELVKEKLNLWLIDEQQIYPLHPRKMGEFLRMELQKVGISAEVKTVSRADLTRLNTQGNADYDLILGSHLAHNFDANSFLATMLSCHQQRENSLANWCSDEFEHLLENARLTEDDYLRELFYRQIQMLLEIELPILPLVNVNRVLLVSSDIEQVNITPFGQVNLSEIRLK